MIAGDPRPPSGAPGPATSWLAAGALLAVAVGVWLRFTGLASLPLADDEYYIVRSVENILRTGLPEYACGGFYPRGLLFQYLSAGLQWLGVVPEAAPRVIAALSSLAVLPAMFLIARRAGGTSLAWLVVAWLALSSWQIEMARFGRMYAPFQAIFAWYLYWYVRYTVDRARPALLGMLAMTVAGALTWEGGALLALANLTPPLLQGRLQSLTRREWLYLGIGAVLFVAVYVFAKHDFRNLVPEQVYPAGYDRDSVAAPGWREVPSMSGPVEIGAWGWLAIAVLPAALSLLAALRTVALLPERRLAAAGLVAALLAAALHEFALVATLLALLIAAGLLTWEVLSSRRMWPWLAAVGCWLLFWSLYAGLGAEWVDGGDRSAISRHATLRAAYNLFSTPDYIMELVGPWLRAAPRLAVLLAAGLAVALLWAGRRERLDGTWRALLFLTILMLAAAAASDPPRHETRYVFFLYPLAIVLAGGVAQRLLAASSLRSRGLSAALAAAFLATFVVTEDSGARADGALMTRDERALLLPAAGPGQSVPRTPGKAAAAWLDARAKPADLVINGVPGTDFYYRHFDFAYIDWTHPRFRAYACERGTRERWGNLRLLYRPVDLDAVLERAERGYVVLTRDAADRLLAEMAPHRARVVWRSADNEILIAELARAPE
jgi:hypothetical protein